MNEVTSRDGTTIAFDLVGGGPALVVVGGALTTAASHASLASLLASTFSTVTYDRRGRGGSGDTQPYAVEREIEDLDAVVGAAGDGPAFVYGHSSGAVLALDAAAAGVPIARLALYEPPFVVDASRAPVPTDYVEHLEALIAEDRRGDAMAYFLTAGVGLPADEVSSMRDAPLWTGLEEVANTLANDGRIMRGLMSGAPLPTDRWRALAVPVLAMDGGASPAWARAAVRALASHLPDARSRTLEGQTHAVADEAIAPELVSFFS